MGRTIGWQLFQLLLEFSSPYPKALPMSQSSASKNAKKTALNAAPVSRSGRFTSGPGADVAQFTESISFDWRLWRQDILGSIVHAEMLRKIGVLTKTEEVAIVRG